MYNDFWKRGDTVKVLFRQSGKGALDSIGVQDCYFKQLSPARDNRSITKKAHHHSDAELHIVTCGTLVYALGDDTVTVEQGQYLLICPTVTHRFIRAEEATQKFAITFSHPEALPSPYCLGALSSRTLSALPLIEEEARHNGAYSALMIENAVTEILITVLRQAGLPEQPCSVPAGTENTTLTLAKAFIRDNVERSLSVAAVAAYCYLCPKQLTRIFERYEGTSPARFITEARLQRIKELLTESTLSLAQISERMHFSSEYYFSAFFKKHAGLPPGQYRRMLG